MKKGIDISIWQKDFTNYKLVRSNGLSFAILKISEGQSKDRAFEQHYEGLRAQGVPTGVYVFSHAQTATAAQREAQFALDVLAGRDLKLPVFLDMEASDINFGWNVSVMSQALAFGEVIKSAGYKWGVYANRSWWQNKLDAQAVREAGGVVWCAEYGVTVPQIDCDIWQYADNGRISGYNHKLDMNALYKVGLLDGDSDSPFAPIEPVDPLPDTVDMSTLPTLRYGDKGTEVWQAQKWLQELGYDIDDDGEFGPATRAVVKTFQAAQGLDNDGIVGPMTWAALAKAVGVQTPAEPAEPDKPAEPEWREPDKFVSVQLPVLEPGTGGDYVETLQILLAAADYYDSDFDGRFGELTKRAVMGYQADNGLETTGKVDAETWTKLLLGGD